MMRSRRGGWLLLLLLLPLAALAPGVGRAEVPASPVALQDNANTDDAVRIPEDPEAFRAVLLGFVHDMDESLQRALAHPELASRAASMSPGQLVRFPLSRDIYAAFENAGVDELNQLRAAFVQAPDVLDIPAVLDAALAQLPPAEAGRAVNATCSDNYTETQKFVGLQGSSRALTRTLDVLNIVYSIIDTITEIVGAATEDVAYVGKRPSLPLIIVRGILGFVNTIIGFSNDIVGYEIELSQLCVAGCLTDAADVTGTGPEPRAQLRFRGCDNRDNNCMGGIDDMVEDQFAPTVHFDAAIVGQCFPNVAAAQSAVDLAINAVDDCSDPTISSSLGAVSSATCEAAFSVTATDASGNSTQANASYQKLLIDGTPPVVTAPTLAACYPDVAAARSVFTGSGLMVSDCTGVDLAVDVVEKECVADFELTASDSCNNRTQVRDRARIDADAPTVDIERLVIPAVDGLACFSTQADAVAAVSEATQIADRCTAPEDLMSQITTSGPACDLLVTASAADECGNASSDSLLVRVDPTVPKVTCSVATSVLYPDTEEMVDIGFSYTATDACEPAGPRVTVEVTTDEPTALAYTVIAGDDPYPDAVLTRALDGTVRAIAVRAQRAQNADGRVYRIRVTGTDSCGLESYADCFVTVPRSQPGPGSAINSGQGFDATKEN